jgi:hypothetical protein
MMIVATATGLWYASSLRPDLPTTPENAEKSESANTQQSSTGALAELEQDNLVDRQSPRINEEYTPALMAAVFPAGTPNGTAPIGNFRIGDRVGLITGTDSDEECHACSGSLSFYYLKMGTTGLEVEKSFPALFQSGAWGTYSRDIQFGSLEGPPPIVAMIISEGYTAQGCTVSSTDIVLLSADGPQLALSVPMGSYSEDREVSGELAVEPSPNSVIDIRYVRKNPLPELEVVVPFSITPDLTLIPKSEIPLWASDEC